MTRRLSEMSEVEKSQFRNQRAILDNTLSTVEEKKHAQVQIDALAWEGQTGPVMALISKLTARLDKVESQGQSISGDDREALIELRQLSKRFDGNYLDSMKVSVAGCLNQLAELALTENQHHEDNQGGWSKHEQILVKARLKRQEIEEKIDTFTQRVNDKFREVEKRIDTLRFQGE